MAKKVQVLNASGQETAFPVPPSATELASRLQQKMLRMKAEHMAEDGRGVGYSALAQSSLFKEFVQLARELSSCDVSSLSNEEKKAFFINVYNALTVHGLALAPPTSVLDVDGFWRSTCYNIAGHIFSLDDIEHGILRGNRPHPSATEPPFCDGDPRLKFSLQTFDPRIHFALVCGAKSCPAIQVYSAQNLDSALASATHSFCSQEVEVEEGKVGGGEGVEGGRVTLSKIFHWYAADFGSSEQELLRWLTSHLPGPQGQALERLLDEGAAIQVQTKEYNWLLNKL